MTAPRTLRAVRVALSGLAVTALLSGCAILDGPPLDAPERTTLAAPATPPEFFPDGSAHENLPYFTETIRAFAASDATVQGRPVVEALEDAGFDREDMQVSFDESKTGLAADHIYASILIDDTCLIAQVISDDRSFVTETAPAVGPESTLCLIGETRPIDW